MNSNRIAAVVGAFVLVVAGTVVAAAPANALSAPKNFNVKVLIGGLTTGFFDDPGTVSGATEHAAVNVEAGGVALGGGTTTAVGNGGSETFEVPLISVGSVHNQEQVEFTATDVETDGLGGDSVATLTLPLTCNLDAAGNGECS
jgi:hypothetical protein